MQYKKYFTKQNTLIAGGMLVLLPALFAFVYYDAQQKNLNTNAAGAASVEAENGTKTGNVINVNDVNASGGQYAKFGSASAISKVKYKIGSEHVATPAGVDMASAMGISLSMNYYLEPNSPTAVQMRAKGMTYLDRNIADMVYGACGPGVPIGSCNPTTTQEDAVMTQVMSHLNNVKDDPTIAGYYIIDDYPGNVKNLLTRITQAVHTVHQNNPKPTVCAFVATLDFKTSPTGPWLPAHYAFDQAIVNYSAQACDVPDLYAYGVAQTSVGCIPSTQVDWTGSNLIPYVKSVLQSKGWNPADGFMITPQTFDNGPILCPNQEYNTPTGDDIKTQTAAFCAAGATSTLSYIWANPDPSYPERGLQHVADWRQGYQEGVNQCKQIWASQQ